MCNINIARWIASFVSCVNRHCNTNGIRLHIIATMKHGVQDETDQLKYIVHESMTIQKLKNSTPRRRAMQGRRVSVVSTIIRYSDSGNTDYQIFRQRQHGLLVQRPKSDSAYRSVCCPFPCGTSTATVQHHQKKIPTGSCQRRARVTDE